ncbi:MAG: hypothetical protein M3362_01340 [Acidobacteriota bacterium]|nr:hypothetical protein [Acidobacteriota bacterium]
MLLSETTNLQGLAQEFGRFTGIGAANVTGTVYTEYVARANAWLDRAVGVILAADNRWQWDDTNYSDAPTGTINIISGTDTYDLPTTWNLLRLERFEILNSAGVATLLSPIDQADIAEGYTTYQGTAGSPLEIDVRGNKLTLKPAPNYTLSGGLRVYYQRRPYYFAADGTDDNKEPGIPSIAHRLLSYGPAYDYAIEKTLPNASLLREEIGLMEGRLEEFIGERSRYEKPQLKPRRESFR